MTLLKAPSFNLQAQDGKTYTLKDFAGKKLVIYFYPKDMTPGCTQESCDFRDSFSRLKALNVQVLGVSKDSIESHQKFAKTYSLPFLLLADPELEMCKAYGVWIEKSMYGRKYMGIDRATFVIDEKGKVLAQFSKVKVKGHVDEVIAVLQPGVSSKGETKTSVQSSGQPTGQKAGAKKDKIVAKAKTALKTKAVAQAQSAPKIKIAAKAKVAAKTKTQSRSKA